MDKLESALRFDDISGQQKTYPYWEDNDCRHVGLLGGFLDPLPTAALVPTPSSFAARYLCFDHENFASRDRNFHGLDAQLHCVGQGVVGDFKLLEALGGCDHAGYQSRYERRHSLTTPASDLDEFDITGLQADLFEYLERYVVAGAANPVDNDLFFLIDLWLF